MEEEVKYTSEFDGQTTDEILKHAKSVKDLTIPSLSNISGFVCIDNEGKAIGMMSKEQVAQVVGGLIGTANLTKDGLLEKELYANRAYNIQLSNDIWHKIGRLYTAYTSIRLVGVEVISGTEINIYICKRVTDIKYSGTKISSMTLKMDNNGYIYIKVAKGVSVSGWLYGDISYPCSDEQLGTSEPSGLTDIPVA